MNPTLRQRILPTPVPWWGRLEVRVIAALCLLGFLCVGASAYLVQLAVGYFDEEVEVSLEQSADVAASIEPFYHDLVDAEIAAFGARGKTMALELALADREASAPSDAARLESLLAANADVVGLVLSRPEGATTTRDRAADFPETEFDWFDVEHEVPGLGAASAGTLRVSFLIDPEIDARYQALGERKREIGVRRGAQDDIEAAVERVVGIASVVVLATAVLAGLFLARTTTKKATELSAVMARVGRGDLSARAGRLGRDELGQLAMAFNHMLDELRHAQERVGYLQRIGAWQGMARRIAHEIKNPLTPIQLAVQQLREKDPGLSPAFSALIKTSTEIVQDEVEALRRMVTSFSRFAKVPEVRLERVDVARVLAEFERAYGHLTENEDDVLDVVDETGGETILGDRQLLKQVLVNLVENASLSAHEAGKKPVRVEVRAAVEDAVVVLTVDDNGPGIDRARLETVFEPYETSREQGTGLGLAIVKKVVLDHGGEVWAERSKLGGARFVIRLAVANAADDRV